MFLLLEVYPQDMFLEVEVLGQRLSACVVLLGNTKLPSRKLTLAIFPAVMYENAVSPQCHQQQSALYTSKILPIS